MAQTRKVCRIVAALKASLLVVDATELLVLRVLCFGALLYEFFRAFMHH